MNEKVDVKEGCERLSFLFVAVKWQDNNVIYTVYYVQILYLCMMGEQGVHIKSLSSGHDGSISTGHSGSPEEMLSRLETMVLMGTDIPLLAIRKQIASAIDIIVQLERLRDKSRRVTEITEVIGCDEGEIKLNQLFIFKEDDEHCVREDGTYWTENKKVSGQLVLSGNRLYHRKKLEAAAIFLEEGL